MLRGLKSRDGAVMRPYLVDEEEDRMCFVISRSAPLPSDITALFQFLYPVPPALKVLANVFESVGLSTEKPLAFDTMSLSTLLNSTNVDNPAQKANVQQIVDAFMELPVYDFKAYDNFFWTSPSEATFFASLTSSTAEPDSAAKSSASVNPDKARYDAWTSYAQHLKTIVNSTALAMKAAKTASADGAGIQAKEEPTAADVNEDPCQFKSLNFTQRLVSSF